MGGEALVNIARETPFDGCPPRELAPVLGASAEHNLFVNLKDAGPDGRFL